MAKTSSVLLGLPHGLHAVWNADPWRLLLDTDGIAYIANAAASTLPVPTSTSAGSLFALRSPTCRQL